MSKNAPLWNSTFPCDRLEAHVDAFMSKRTKIDPCVEKRWCLLQICPCSGCLVFAFLVEGCQNTFIYFFSFCGAMFQVRSNTRSRCTIPAWRRSTACPWLLWWTSSSCVCMAGFHQRSTRWTTSRRYNNPSLASIFLLLCETNNRKNRENRSPKKKKIFKIFGVFSCSFTSIL